MFCNVQKLQLRVMMRMRRSVLFYDLAKATLALEFRCGGIISKFTSPPALSKLFISFIVDPFDN